MRCFYLEFVRQAAYHLSFVLYAIAQISKAFTYLLLVYVQSHSKPSARLYQGADQTTSWPP
jgi:hypothetical protein